MEARELVSNPLMKPATRWTRSALNYRIPRRGANYTLLSIIADSASALLAPLLLLRWGDVGISASVFVVCVVLTRIFTFYTQSLYSASEQPRFITETATVSLAVLSSILILLGILALLGVSLELLWVEIMFIMAMITHVGWRVVVYIWSYYRAIRRILAPERVLLIGATEAAREIARAISNFPLPTTYVVGYLDNNLVGTIDNVPVIGSLKDNIFNIIREYQVDEIILTTTRHIERENSAVILDLPHVPINIRCVPSYLNLNVYSTRADSLDQLQLIHLHRPMMSTNSRLLKRTMDVVLAVLGLTATLPFFCLVALLIWLEDRGPVFFEQERYGEKGKIFKMLKFRSMVINADKMVDDVTITDENNRTIYKRQNDMRVTQIGKFIRKTSLDELPQLINILRGDMSLVGPRPEVRRIVETEYKPWQFARMRVPQGLTGWWQVTGRSEKECYTDTEKDLFYIENYSIWFDIKIILMTVPALLRGRGAF